jgi:hypothetical protein
VEAWNQQYGDNQTVGNDFFGAADDKEERDPDGANTDGGTDQPQQKTAGDSLSVLQEYRGFILDGGPGGFAGGHKRLSPAQKGLLVETDAMTGVTHMPTRADLEGVLGDVVANFSDATDGAGVFVYWVIDQFNVGPHELFANRAARETWADNHRNDQLGEFVHLMFADKRTDNPTPGTSGTYGAYVFVESDWDLHTTHNLNFLDLLAHTAAHEITHLLLNTDGSNGFDAGEHLDNPDPSDGPKMPSDYRYLMYSQTTRQNAETIYFSNPTRKQIDLKSKESVERD